MRPARLSSIQEQLFSNGFMAKAKPLDNNAIAPKAAKKRRTSNLLTTHQG